eukprot:m.46673 g.46673  ORF g.46673 m.46673 type:complete len:949 (+) comp20303_c0_seq1:475-3321(+)
MGNACAGLNTNSQTPVQVRPFSSNLRKITQTTLTFRSLCKDLFNLADADGNGVLDYREFRAAFSSSTLKLGLSENEMKRLMKFADRSQTGVVNLEEFIHLVKNLNVALAQVLEAETSTDDRNDWCHIRDPQTQQLIYMNKRTGQTKQDKPAGFESSRVEPLEFEYFTLDDGTEIVLHGKDDQGNRLYLDWELQTWASIPAQWEEQMNRRSSLTSHFSSGAAEVAGGGGGGNRRRRESRKHIWGTESRDSARGQTSHASTFDHPTRGQLDMFMFENSRKTRLVFNEDEGQWVRMEMELERDLPEIKNMLDKIQAAVPTWKNPNERLLALRDCNYDVAETIAFGQINFNEPEIEVEEEDPAAMDSLTLSSLGLSSFGSASMKSAKRVANLEKELAIVRKEFGDLQDEKAESEVQVNTLRRRQSTLYEVEKFRLRDEENDETRTKQLAKKVNEQRIKIYELEQKLASANLTAQTNTFAKSSTPPSMTELQNQLHLKDLLIAKLTADAERIDTTQIQQLHKRAKELQKVKDELGSLRTDFMGMEDMFIEATKLARKLSENTKKQVHIITAKYRAECIHRKLLYNTVQELRGNIRVYLRCRGDDSVPASERILQFPTDQEVVAQSLRGDPIMMEFNRTYDTETTQEQIFKDTKPVVLSVLDGYNVCIVAYGQTGSGKTHTMIGPESDPGVNRRTLSELMGLISQEDGTLEVTVHAAMYEIYNERAYDLLAPGGRVKRDVRVGEEGVFIHGLTEKRVKTKEDAAAIMSSGDERRTVFATKMNSSSSRSHLIFQLRVSTYNKISKVHTQGKLAMVDLAGSERVAKSEVSGQQLLEAAAVNKSLSALSQVFNAISQGSSHVPYRNSMLTHVLMEYLGGDAKACVFVHVRPDRINLSETLSTMNFGGNIKQVQLGRAKATTSKKNIKRSNPNRKVSNPYRKLPHLTNKQPMFSSIEY